MCKKPAWIGLRHSEVMAGAAGGLIDVVTNREREIVQLIVTGVSNKELSRRLGTGEGTAKVHLHNIYEKLGITKRSELMTRM